MQLVINTFGAKLSRHNQLFEVKTPKNTAKRFHPQRVRSILISKGVILSTDALMLALAHDIEVVLIARSGKPLGRIWNGRFGSIATIRKQQTLWAADQRGAYCAALWIKRKLMEQVAFCRQLHYGGWLPDLPDVQQALALMERNIAKIDHFGQHHIPPEWQATLRGWEGTSSAQYFKILAMAVPEPYKFTVRSRPAADMFNCLLNYLYGILYGRVEEALIHAGIDPFIGFMHAEEYNKPVLTYDFIEPYRIWAETVAVRLCMAHALRAPEHFSAQISRNIHSVWLSTAGKQIVIEYFNNYLGEIIQRNQLFRSRATHLSLEAQNLASQLNQK